jgi:chorismate lyase/3-hydroxybenzoate synthase
MSSLRSPSASERSEHVIAFGEPTRDALFVPLRPLGDEPPFEVWAMEDDLLFGSLSIDDAIPLEQSARETYAQLIAQARAAGYPYFVRMWNYVGDINAHDEDRERYQLFCAGRHDAFVEAGYHHDVDLPAASAVGMRGRGLIAYFLAAREPGTQVENPRQVAAYRYPPEYGSKSPSFSRATVWRDRVFVSGTSSVHGHATVHRNEVTSQLDETLLNIETVLAQTGRTLDNVISAKTYIRRAADYERIASRLAGVLPSNLYLEADICRADLLLEIECVAR